MIKHRVLSPGRFVGKFQDNGQMLRDFVKLWGGGLNVEAAILDVPAFKKLFAEGDGNPGGFVSRGKRRRFTGHCEGRGYGVNQTT